MVLIYPPSPSKSSSSPRRLPRHRSPASERVPTSPFTQIIFTHRPRLVLLLLVLLSLSFVFVYTLATFTAQLPDWNEENLEGWEDRLFEEGPLPVAGGIEGWREFDAQEWISTNKGGMEIPELGWTKAFSADCLDEWISKGTLCSTFPKIPSEADARVDVITTWTNGSDTLLLDWRRVVSDRLREASSGSRTQSWGDNPQNLKHFRYVIRFAISPSQMLIVAGHLPLENLMSCVTQYGRFYQHSSKVNHLEKYTF